MNKKILFLTILLLSMSFVIFQTNVEAECPHDKGVYMSGDSIEPTCTSPGEYYWVCNLCGEIIKKEYLPVSGHSFEPDYFGHVKKKAKPGQDGIFSVSCTECSLEKTSRIAAPKKMVLSATKYNYDGKNKKPSVKVYDSNNNIISSIYYKLTYPKESKKAGKYIVKLQFCEPYNPEMDYLFDEYEGTMTASYTIVATVKPKVPAKMKKPQVKKVSKKKIKVMWNKLSGVNGYQISKSTAKNTTGKIYTIKNAKKDFKVLKVNNKTYYYKIRAYKVFNKKKVYGTWSKVKKYVAK